MSNLKSERNKFFQNRQMLKVAQLAKIFSKKRVFYYPRLLQCMLITWVNIFKQMDFEVTDDAYVLEQKVLEWLRQTKKLNAYLSEFEMPQGGYSETVDASEITLVSIWAKVEEFSKVKK